MVIEADKTEGQQIFQQGTPSKAGTPARPVPRARAVPRARPVPQQGRYTEQGWYPEQGQYPEQGRYPEQGQYPQQDRYPEQGRYPPKLYSNACFLVPTGNITSSPDTRSTHLLIQLTVIISQLMFNSNSIFFQTVMKN